MVFSEVKTVQSIETGLSVVKSAFATADLVSL